MNDLRWLARAAELAAPWLTFPNPRVGCVLVNAAGEVVGEGAHHELGAPHAEVNALRVAGAAAHGATAYVTLEPCAHTGRTGPCTEALIAAGVSRVVFGVADPNPAAAGGASVLQAAGVRAALVPSPECETVNEHWLLAVREQRPFVTLKLATTLDGRVAAAEGLETPISNAASRVRLHELRARVDGILVGTNTAIVDDPRLDVREAPASRQPLRFVMGERHLPSSLALLATEPRATQLFTHDPVTVLANLHAREIRHLLVEGGPTVARAFLEAGLVDECIWITAPKVFGSGPTAFGAPPLPATVAWRRQHTVDVEGDLWSYLRRH